PLGQLLAEPALAHLRRNPAHQITTRSRVTGLHVEGGKLSGVMLGERRLPTDTLILATPPIESARLLAPHSATAALASELQLLGSQPITTVYLHYPDQPRPAQTMLGLSGYLSQWLFDRRVCGQAGWFAVVISAEGEHTGWSQERLGAHVEQELARALPDWPQRAVQRIVIRERRATFECRVDIDTLRPDNATPIHGLWLAGDYTATGYPATLEGAVRSGVECARRLLDRRKNHS
ncbi:MAG: hydroxysqualene dehydroxylase, partial [Pseudomonadota bacterium]